MTTKLFTDEIKGLKILKKITEKGDKKYVFYDIEFFNTVIVKGCKVAKSQKGDFFLSLPAEKSGEKYYPICLVEKNFADNIISILTDKSTVWMDTDIKSLSFKTKTQNEDDVYPF